MFNFCFDVPRAVSFFCFIEKNVTSYGRHIYHNHGENIEPFIFQTSQLYLFSFFIRHNWSFKFRMLRRTHMHAAFSRLHPVFLMWSSSRRIFFLSILPGIEMKWEQGVFCFLVFSLCCFFVYSTCSMTRETLREIVCLISKVEIFCLISEFLVSLLHSSFPYSILGSPICG